jgi:hypothetical protein
MSGRPNAFQLDAALIARAIEALQQRIQARFEAAGLAAVCADLAQTARATGDRVEELGRPILSIRIATGAMLLVLVALAAVLFGKLAGLSNTLSHSDVFSMTQGLDSGVNLMILAFGGLWFLWGMENRIKRRGALRWLYELRAIAHVIDMHQLTKYPSSEMRLGATPVSPEHQLSDPQLARYFDYCIEMLAMTAKLAAEYAGVFEDAEVISAIGDVEDLTSDLSRRIWQKLLIISVSDEPGPRKPEPAKSVKLARRRLSF